MYEQLTSFHGEAHAIGPELTGGERLPDFVLMVAATAIIAHDDGSRDVGGQGGGREQGKNIRQSPVFRRRSPAPDMSWQEMGNCLGVDPDLFFPERGASSREAKEVCRGCVVQPDCLEFALANGEKFGIWGGMSERERRRIRRQRALERQRAAAAGESS